MPKFYLSILLLFLFSRQCAAQRPDTRWTMQQSAELLVYRIPADSAERYLKGHQPDPAGFYNQPPFVTWTRDHAKEELPIGHYLIFNLRKHELHFEYFNQTSFLVRPVNSNTRLRLEVRDSLGGLIPDARGWINGREMPWQPRINGFEVPLKKPDGALVRITVRNDTSFTRLTEDDEDDYRYGQEPAGFRYSGLWRTLRWPVVKVRQLAATIFRREMPNRAQAYMLFNKAVYRPGDTVLLKAYIIRGNKKPMTGPMGLQLSYSDKQGYQYIDLGILHHTYPGSYPAFFVIGDTLPADRDYTVTMLNKKMQGTKGKFRIEDYLNEEVGKRGFTAGSDRYFRGDSLEFSAWAKDAAGLPVMEGRVRFCLLSRDVSYPQKDRLFIPDTIWQEEKKLLTGDDTRFVVPAGVMPPAVVGLKAVAVFLGANNESHEETIRLEYEDETEQVITRMEGPWMYVEYRVNGVPTDTVGTFTINDEDQERPINYPSRFRIHPFAEEYTFTAGDAFQMEEVSMDQRSLQWQYIQEEDSCGFTIENPMGLLVHYNVTLGKKIIATGADTVSAISWKSRLKKKTGYAVNCTWIWQGVEQRQRFMVYALDKLLKAETTALSTVYPGQTDSVRIRVTDRKERPAANVNLSVASYNAQHHSRIRVAEPPYVEQVHNRQGRKMKDPVVTEIPEAEGSWLLAAHHPMREKFSADTIPYYQLLRPRFPYTRVSRVISDPIPQVSVYVMKRGVPQEIHLLSVNNRFDWYNDVTEKPSYSFHAVHGYNRFTIRLDSFRLIIDSIYLQPYYKHHLSFDIDSLPPGSVRMKLPPFLGHDEKEQLQRSIIRFESHQNANSAWVMQENRQVFLMNNRLHRVGPFLPGDSIVYYKPGEFVQKFMGEGDYIYRVSPGVTRMVADPLMDYRKPMPLKKVNGSEWIISDTIREKPAIRFTTDVPKPDFLQVSMSSSSPLPENARLRFLLPRDSSFTYLVLYNEDTSIVKRGFHDRDLHLPAATYQIVLVTSGHSFLVIDSCIVRPDGLTLVSFSAKPVYASYNRVVDILHRQATEAYEQRKREYFGSIQPQSSGVAKQADAVYPAGSAVIEGRITDRTGKDPVPNANVKIEGYASALLADPEGIFRLPGVKAGRYTITISMSGYERRSVDVQVAEGGRLFVPVELNANEYSLNDVVVVSYGTQKKSTLTAAISTVNYTESLSGKVAGVSVSDAGMAEVRIRGFNSLGSDNTPLYIVNGIPMDGPPDESMLAGAQVMVLKNTQATALYGSRAAGGAVVITTNGFQGPAIRNQFRDYAAWIPDLFTDRNGEAVFPVTYPDNLTGWETFVLGMDRKRRYVKTRFVTRTFKPVVAQLFTPSFLVEGDSSIFTGKLANYTDEKQSVRWSFGTRTSRIATQVNNAVSPGSVGQGLPSSANDVVLDIEASSSAGQGGLDIEASSSVSLANRVYAAGEDSIEASFSLGLLNNYRDGEIKRIPVLRRGSLETTGKFWLLDRDSMVSFSPDTSGGAVNFYAMSNTTELMLEGLENLKLYPWFCLEQSVSKLRGLVLERDIRKHLKQPFRATKMMAYLVEKIQSAQLPDGSWPWWKGGPSDYYISNYVMRCLTGLPDNPLLQSTTRSAVLYLANNLRYRKGNELLESLYTMSEVGHEMDYGPYLRGFVFDSLAVHQQWQYTRILQNVGQSVTTQLDKLMKRKQSSMLGNVYWGHEDYRWYSNSMATTVLAFRVLSEQGGYDQELRGMIGYFIDRRAGGQWSNTVETASVLSVMLPYALQNQPSFTSRPVLTVDGTTRIDSFPRRLRLDPAHAATIKKSGGGYVYVSVSQEQFNPDPQPVANDILIDSWFEVSGRKSATLTAGTNAVMKISVEMKRDAEYVQFEIPIPAGCTYAAKPQGYDGVHREYLKDRMVFFVPSMKAGKYSYEIRLEPRYPGVYHINPAKSSLMYFPVFYGRTGIKTMPIEK